MNAQTDTLYSDKPLARIALALAFYGTWAVLRLLVAYNRFVG